MPLRSTGCATCRRRKIRVIVELHASRAQAQLANCGLQCDETWPACQKCATHGVLCPGYRQVQRGGVEIRDQTQHVVNKAKARKDSKISRRKSSAPTSGSSSSTAVTPQSTSASEDAVVLFKGEHCIRGPGLLEIASPVLERAQAFSLFINLMVPRDEARGAIDHFSHMSTTRHFLPSREPALQAALDSLCLVQIGTSHNDERLLYESRRRYGVALAALAQALSKPDAAHNDDLLGAAFLLGFCEVRPHHATMSACPMR